MQGIRKVYDTGKVKVEALRGVDLEVQHGEFVAIVGPSGSGKSTLMNLIGCLDTPTVRRLPAARRSGGRAEPRRSWPPSATAGSASSSRTSTCCRRSRAFENVEMPLLFGGVSRRKRRQRVDELLERVGLADRMEHKPTELSGGQMQRVAIARALAMDPDIILADEPTGNLDTSSGGDIMELFDELWKTGRTMLVITHDPALARRAPAAGRDPRRPDHPRRAERPLASLAPGDTATGARR